MLNPQQAAQALLEHPANFLQTYRARRDEAEKQRTAAQEQKRYLDIRTRNVTAHPNPRRPATEEPPAVKEYQVREMTPLLEAKENPTN